MTDSVLIGVLIGGFYTYECIAWLPRGSTGLRAHPDRPWRWLGTATPDEGRSAPKFAGWFPGTGGVAILETGPPPVSPMGLCTCASRGAAIGRPVMPFDELGRISADGAVIRRGVVAIVRCASAERARALAAWIRTLAGMTEKARSREIRSALGSLLDSDAASARVERFRAGAHALRWPTRVLTLLVAALPFVWRVGLPWTWYALGAIALLTAGTAAIFGRWRHRLLGGASNRSAVALMVASPLTATRADDALARASFGDFHVLAVAHSACPDREARRLVERAWREMVFVPEPEREPCCAAGAWVRAQWFEILEAWIERRYGPTSALLSPPAPESTRSRSYCPRCTQQYERDGGTCVDCAGVKLEVLSAAPI